MQTTVDHSGLETDGIFLEGTGRRTPRPAPEREPTAAVAAIDHNAHTADGQDVAMGDVAH